MFIKQRGETVHTSGVREGGLRVDILVPLTFIPVQQMKYPLPILR